MKKTLTFILVLAMVFALCACGGSKNPLIGTWEGKNSESSSIRFSFTDRVLTITFLRSGEAQSYEYEILDENHIKVNQGAMYGGWTTMYVHVNGNTLTFTEDGNNYTLYRVK